MKILIADDHALFRDSLRSLLEAHGLEVIGEAKNGREAVELAHKLKPDVVLMDLSMPEMDGLAATRLISADQPNVKVVVLTASDEDSKLFEAIKSGAQGYLLKNLESEDFFTLLDGVNRGEPALTPALARKLLQEFAKPSASPSQHHDPDALTEREREVMKLVAAGRANKQIAAELGISEVTVKVHRGQVMRKMRARSLADLVRMADRLAPIPKS
jgi:DNA-binding NarL/FixJ family response regulator